MESTSDIAIKRPTLVIRLGKTGVSEINDKKGQNSENRKSATPEQQTEDVKTAATTTLDLIETIATNTGTRILTL